MTDDVVLLGLPLFIDLTAEERAALDGVCPTTIPEHVSSHKRAVIKGYLTAADKIVTRRNQFYFVCKCYVALLKSLLTLIMSHMFSSDR